ncbi:MAG: hypothetical protein ACRDT2_05710 [Natronosporangium sp.]
MSRSARCSWRTGIRWQEAGYESTDCPTTRSRFIGPPVGILTGATLQLVDRALRDRLDL